MEIGHARSWLRKGHGGKVKGSWREAQHDCNRLHSTPCRRRNSAPTLSDACLLCMNAARAPEGSVINAQILAHAISQKKLAAELPSIKPTVNPQSTKRIIQLMVHMLRPGSRSRLPIYAPEAALPPPPTEICWEPSKGLMHADAADAAAVAADAAA